jgi:hypothetical protein
MPLIGMSQTVSFVRTITLAVRGSRILADSLIQYH